ncbi:phage tail tape measure protein [Bradyrhizobium sp. BRP56]|uniref:phage tail tape measure protein n=1 Tax=Bradyrhizobium sp. BRP56 TaxID=2793819 RepID=UPI001CD553CA|nr:phage tail tape measure protein [Bradyrhizobium sp. BRP56]MCA1397469.1 phage tail tape measure protein [Bradyrhizobium sp. BRP56]
MSEIISVHASLTATDSASPVIAGLLRNVRKLEAAVKSINGVSASKLFPDSVAPGLQKITDDARKAASTYRTEWKSAYADSLRDARAFHRELDRLDRQTFNRRQAEQRAVSRGAFSGGRGALPRGISPTTTLISGGITISGVASAFKRRMEADVAETKAQIFGGLSQAEVKRLRGDWSDQVAIRFGESAAAVLDSYTEALKQGFDASAAKKVTENALEASSALEMNIGELMKLAGKTATSLYGNVRNADPARVARMMTSVAVAAAATAADPNELVEANKRALSALSTTKIKETDLSAFTSVGISAGLQPNKAGTFLGFLTSEFANAGNARGQRAKDLDQAARMIGYGGRSQMAQRMASAPTEFMLNMFEKMRNMTEQSRAKFANLAGMREWRDELVQMAKAGAQIRETLKEIDEKSSAASAFSATKLNSLQKRWDRIKAMFGLAWEKFGSGFEQSFIEVSDWFDRHTGIFTSGKIGEKSREFVERLKKAFGVANMGEALDKIAAKISSIDVDKIIGFASGFVGGLKSVSDTVITMLKGAATAMGKDGNSAEVLGKLAGQIVALSVALGLLAPVIAVLSGFANIVSRIAGLLTGRALLGAATANPVGTAALLAWLLAKNNDAGMPDTSKRQRKPDGRLESVQEWRDRQREHKRQLYQKQSGEGFNPADVHPMSYIGNKLDNLGGKIERTSFMGITDLSSRNRNGGLSYAYQGAGSSGAGGGGGGMGRLLSGVGTPDALIKGATPGGQLPNFGAGSGGIIRRGGKVGMGYSTPDVGTNIPAGGVGDTSTGMGLSGNAYLAARRKRFDDEMKSDPTLKRDIAAMQLTEGASGGGTVESLYNRADMMGWSLRKTLGYFADGSQSVDNRGRRNSFYGPIRRGELPAAIAKLNANPKLRAKYDAYTDAALRGSHKIGGFTDQGLPTDPNGTVTRRRKGLPALPTVNFGGNEFTEWGGTKRSRDYRLMIEKGIAGSGDSPIKGVPSPAEAVKNVPAAPTSGVPLRGDFGSRGSNVAIHINGNSHDPEALATLVQRRVDESMNWRTHDSESEYT